MQTTDLYEHHNGELQLVLADFYERNDDQRLRDFIDKVQSECEYVNGSTAKLNGYLRVLANFAKDKVFDAYAASRAQRNFPEISLTYQQDLKPVFGSLGLPPPGSPQDVLYTYTSERAGKWIPSLTRLGFLSAYMSGPGTCTLLTSERFLNVNAPQKILDELKGAIVSDFFINLDLIKKTEPDLVQILEHLESPDRDLWTEQDIQDLFDQHAKSMNGYTRGLINILQQLYRDPKKQMKIKVQAWNNALRPSTKKTGSQEQLVLKYISEANLLQKFLDGKMVDHVQSNLKMQPNPLRKNKVEVDSVYGVIGSSGSEIIIVEAKDKTVISNTQLYGLYEAYRLRLPPQCKLTLIAALLEDDDDSISIDLIKVGFPDEYLTDPTASILNMSIDKHYKWRISR